MRINSITKYSNSLFSGAISRSKSSSFPYKLRGPFALNRGFHDLFWLPNPTRMLGISDLAHTQQTHLLGQKRLSHFAQIDAGNTQKPKVQFGSKCQTHSGGLWPKCQNQCGVWKCWEEWKPEGKVSRRGWRDVL